MGKELFEADLSRRYADETRSEAGVEQLLEGSHHSDRSLEQVREILFGAESRRADQARQALAGTTAERFDRLEAEHERRFEKLLLELNQRFEKAMTLLEKESADRREALCAQHEELSLQFKAAARTLTQTKTDREELANLLNDVANRLRNAGAV